MYNFEEIEKKWQQYWEDTKTYKTLNDFDKPKYYCLDMFPFPSGAGLHVGHPKGMTANDIVARYKNANGYNVLHPMGWDAFGLPAENYAIKTGTHPSITTKENIDNFRKQIKSLGFSYDWDREIDTTDPKYYKWTQFIFLKLFEHGLAYEQDLPINYCPSCKTSVANEEVLNDFTHERCGTKVEKKKLRQWVLAITKYADRLLSDVDNLDWPESIKDMQRNWIGKSEGCEFEMKKTQKKGELPTPKMGEHNVQAKFSSIISIIENTLKVKQKIKFKGKLEINGYIDAEIGRINFNSENIIKHFSNKKPHELYYRQYLLATVFTSIDKIKFYENNIGYFIYKTLVIKVVLGKQSNGNFFVKTYYKSDVFSQIYKSILNNKIQEDNKKNLFISVYTTRIDTVFGMTYAVMAPDHKDVMEFITENQKEVCLNYIENSKSKSDQDRTASKEKTGVFTGSYVINPFNNKEVPVWIGDYVLGNYGTGAVMAVPSHDERDFEFAKKYDLEIIQSISGGDINEKAFTLDGVLVNSGEFNGLKSEEARKILTEFAEKNGFGIKKINYKLRDWLFSRQRYWGEPIPLIHLEEKDLKNLPHINEEDFIKKQDKILNLINKKMRDAPLVELEWGTPMGTTANLSHIDIIFKNTLKVKKKSKKSFSLKKVFTVINNNDREIRVSGRYLILHFLEKPRYEFLKRFEFSQTVIQNLDKVNFLSDNFGLLNINGQFWVVITEKIEEGIYDLVTYYNFKSLNDVLNTAYILKRKPNSGESIQRISCKNGDIRELVIGGKVVSKIYDGIYSKIVCDYNLPLVLPEVNDFEPSGDGNSPLAKVDKFVNVKLANNLYGKRETNTMPQWGGSCWYYLRYMDSNNDESLVNPEIEKYWGQVDSYVGGAEHAVLHLLYARFWHKFMYDIGLVSTNEPFFRLRNQGLILAYAFERKNGGLLANDLVEEKDGKYYEIETGEEVNRIISKMSKSLKNVVNPDDIIKEYGSDSLRLYEMYISDFKDGAPWDTKGIVGVKRFLEKSERLFTQEAKISTEDDNFTTKLLHKTIKKVSEDIENYKFNTAIASLMILVNNGLPKDKELQREFRKIFVVILSPFAPHLAEELWERMNSIKVNSVYLESWPKYDENLVKDDNIIIAIQVLGKLRGNIEVNVNETKENIISKAKELDTVKKWLDGKEIVKEIYVPGKIVNIVVK